MTRPKHITPKFTVVSKQCETPSCERYIRIRSGSPDRLLCTTCERKKTRALSPRYRANQPIRSLPGEKLVRMFTMHAFAFVLTDKSLYFMHRRTSDAALKSRPSIRRVELERGVA